MVRTTEVDEAGGPVSDKAGSLRNSVSSEEKGKHLLPDRLRPIPSILESNLTAPKVFAFQFKFNVAVVQLDLPNCTPSGLVGQIEGNC